MLYNGDCKLECPEGYTTTASSPKNCIKCSNSCLDCEGSVNSCVSCPDGKFLYNSSCMD